VVRRLSQLTALLSLALLGACGTGTPPPKPKPKTPPKPSVDGTTPVLFLDKEQAKEFLSKTDGYLKRLNLFNRQLRMGTDETVSPVQYAEFAGDQALEWTPKEKARISRLLARYHQKLAAYGLEWPEEVKLIKTTGKEDFEAAYTRGDAIILPQKVVSSSDAVLTGFLLHELFHIYTRHVSEERRDDLYGVIGFLPAGPAPALPYLLYARLTPDNAGRLHKRRDISLPYPIVDSAIINPDAYHNRHVIPITYGVTERYGMPVLYSREDEPVAGAEMGFHNIVDIRLFIVAPDDLGRWRMDPDAFRRQEAFVGFEEVDGFFQKTGRNTDYIIHPEEILADNFKLLISGAKDVPSPEILKKLDALLKQKPRKPAPAKEQDEPEPEAEDKELNLDEV